MTSNRDRIDIEKNLDKKDVFEKFIRSYSVYYDVSREDTDDCRFEVAEGFDAEARFDSKSEQYFLVKKAKVADIHSSEYVYFSLKDNLSLDIIKELDQKAWEYAIEQAVPGPDHKNTDSVLIVICDNIEEEAKEFIIKSKHSKNYNFALYGYSNYRLVAIELNKGSVYFNKQARILKELVSNILKEEKEIKR